MPRPARETRTDGSPAAGSSANTLGSRTTLGRVGRLAWAVLGIAGVLALLVLAAGRLSLIVIPLVLALFPATLLVPVAAKLKSIGVPDSLSAIASILLGFLLIGGLIGAMVPLVIAGMPGLIDSASSGIAEIEAFLERDALGLGLGGPAELLEAGRQQLGEFGDIGGQALTAAATAVSTLAGTALLFVILFFYLKDGRRLTEGVVSLAPQGTRRRLLRSADQAWSTLGAYFRGQMLVALIDAVFIGLGLLIMGIPLALPLAVLIFFGALFPLVGAVITGALAVLVALADGGLVSAAIVLGIILGVQQIEGNVLQPMILGRAIDLHPLVVLLSVTAGGVLLGILGAFLAVPTAAIVARLMMDSGPKSESESDSEPEPAAQQTATD